MDNDNPNIKIYKCKKHDLKYKLKAHYNNHRDKMHKKKVINKYDKCDHTITVVNDNIKACCICME